MNRERRELLLTILLGVVIAVSGCILLFSAFEYARMGRFNIISGIVFSFALGTLLYIRFNPDAVAARQTAAVLNLSSSMAAALQEGFSTESAQRICSMILPLTNASAVAITDREHIMGYVGMNEGKNPSGAKIRTIATHQCLDDGVSRVLSTREEIGFPKSDTNTLNAGILVALHRGKKIVGVLKFYYRSPREINDTQVAMCEGLAHLLSTQIAAVEMEQQAQLATSMELKALQTQINPHFLFNTINTIASLVRTDPDRARMLLREFAVFYRRNLENNQDLIEIDRELEQTNRYFMFEVARFGEERLDLEVEIEDGISDLMVPAFMVQPLVENAVRHAMPPEGLLTITVSVSSHGNDAVICVADDGVGMDMDSKKNYLQEGTSKGLGIAMKNINERLKGYFGPESRMEVESEAGKGTKVYMILKDALLDE